MLLLLEALDGLVHFDTWGNPMSLLRWTSKSLAALTTELVGHGFEVSSRTVLRLLHQLGYALKAIAKVPEGRRHPDRDAQFRYLNDLAVSFIADDQPAISVDIKKKEIIGDYAHGGNEWLPEGKPELVQVHDVADRALGEFAKAIPCGIYDVANNEGWVSVGDVADTAEFAVESIRTWWSRMGRAPFPNATGWSSPPMPAGPTGTGSAHGMSASLGSPPKPATPSPSANTRPALASGTGSGTVSSASPL